MRNVSLFARGVVVLAVVALSLSVFAAPRGERPRDPREKRDPIVKVVKRIIKSLGDGLIVPTP
jgi:hypothetical protein